MTQPEPPAPTSRPWLAWALLLAGVAAFTALHTTWLSWKVWGLRPEWGFDLTFFHNIVWNVVEGHGYRQSATYHEPPGVFAETHFEPILLLAVPWYWIAPRLETLLFTQQLLLGLGAIGVYRLARGAGASPLGGAAAGLLFLGWWPLWRMAMADVRPLTWSIPFLLLMLAALRETRRAEALLWGLLACFSREEIPVTVVAACAGVWLATWAPKSERARARRSLALRLALAAGVFFVLTTLLRSNTTFYIRPDEWVRGLLDSSGPSVAEQWGREASEMWGTRVGWLTSWWIVPVGLGALLAPELLLGALPLIVYLFTQGHEWASWEGPYIHHTAPLVAFLGAAAAVGWTRGLLLVRRLPLPPVALPVAASLLVAGLAASEVATVRRAWEPHIEGELRPWLDREDRVLEAWRLARRIPKDAPAMADYDAVHLISGRYAAYCYQQEEIEDPRPPGPVLQEPLLPPAEVQPEWALIKLEHEPWIARVEAAGLRPVDRGEEWGLWGPAD